MSVPLNVIVAHLEESERLRHPAEVRGQEKRRAHTHTHLIVGPLVLLALAVVRFAVGQLPQVGVGGGVQLLPNVVVVAAVGEVVRGVAARAHQVGVGASAQQQLDQREVLLIHRQVQRAAAVPLLLRDRVPSGKASPASPTAGPFFKSECASLCSAHLCVNVRSQIHQVLHQREETLNRGHVEAVLTWKQQELSNRTPGSALYTISPGSSETLEARVTEDKKGAQRT